VVHTVLMPLSLSALPQRGGTSLSYDRGARHRSAEVGTRRIAKSRASACYPQNFMPMDQILYLLIAERDKLNRAI
jgi:hypothetical protein